VRGEIRWCQGYSEPGAGSDLASLADPGEDGATTSSSTARRSGPATPTRPTGSSAWCAPTPTAQAHRHQLRAVRHGQPRRRTQPILLISGKSPFCETFFDNVRVEKRNLVGTLNAAGTSPSTCWRMSGGQSARDWLRTKANSIEGGTSEIQLNILAKHILKLPGA
jgi:alkylation response protein AidB-like acyl-CoA dehydrogenase